MSVRRSNRITLSTLTEAGLVLDRLSWEFGSASRRSQGRGTALLGTRAEAYHKSLSGEFATAFSVTRTSYGQSGITRQGLEQDPNKGLANLLHKRLSHESSLLEFASTGQGHQRAWMIGSTFSYDTRLLSSSIRDRVQDLMYCVYTCITK